MTVAQALGATAAQAQADRLFEQARWHKRQANHHRRRAQEAMRTLEALKADCARLGFRLVVVSSKPAGGTEP